MTFPAIGDHILPLPGALPVSNTTYYAPDTSTFWQRWYRTAAADMQLALPIHDATNHFNPHFSYFGWRFNPVAMTVGQFHSGLDIYGDRRNHVYPVRSGILEYSGYGKNTGQYIFLRHPDIVTDDGFVLYSLYMHLSKRFISFSSYQKMLREISFHTYPEVPVLHTQAIGRIGRSGLPKTVPPHLHVQLEFRAEKTSIVVDPLKLVGMRKRTNKTAHHTSHQSCVSHLAAHKQALRDWRSHWEAYCMRYGGANSQQPLIQ